jgi:hypothetical protein
VEPVSSAFVGDRRAVIFLLLMAFANELNLLLVWPSFRATRLAVRAALGHRLAGVACRATELMSLQSCGAWHSRPVTQMFPRRSSDGLRAIGASGNNRIRRR